MDEPNVSTLLDDLTPPTEYGEFLKLWPQIKDTVERKVRLTVIYKRLKELNLVAFSYVTFTRFVKKVTEDAQGEGSESKDTTKPVQATPEPAKTATARPSESIRPEPPSVVEKSDKSGTVATEAAVALEKSIAASTKKDYAKKSFRSK